MTYLLIGQDNLSKNIQLKNIRQQFLPKGYEQFNLDLIYAKDLTLKLLQERLLCLPVKSAKRIIIIKNAEDLKLDIRQFIIQYVQSPFKNIILILDIDRQEKIDEFIKRVYKYVKVFRFREVKEANTFTLSRWIEANRPDQAIKILIELLKKGEKPERILGGLRFVWEGSAFSPLESRRNLKLLLDCDKDIKTGRLKPNFALEKLVIGLCFFGKSSG